VSSSVTPASMAAWMVRTPSSWSLAPYMPENPMQPRPMGETEGPFVPRGSVSVILSVM
jgi:hypothetical protein